MSWGTDVSSLHPDLTYVAAAKEGCHAGCVPKPCGGVPFCWRHESGNYDDADVIPYREAPPRVGFRVSPNAAIWRA
jgi:hypothetical protein